MLIEFECPNIAEYDAASGRYIVCGKRLVVSDDKIGEMIECGKCNQLVEVPFEAAQPTVQSQQSSSRDKSRPAVAATKAAGDKKRRRIAQKKSQVTEDVLPPPSDFLKFEFEKDSNAPSATYNSYENRCPKCGSPINKKGKCTECRYVEQKFPSAYLPVERIDMQLAGFQRWFCEILSEGVSLRMFEIAMHSLVTFLCIVLILLGVLISGSAGWTLVTTILIGLGVYVAFVFKGHQLRHNPRAQLAWFQKPIWNGILLVFRLTKWQNFDKRNKNRKIIDKRNAPLVDENFQMLEGLKGCQVLDLEGTLVTDRALRTLYGHRYLQCLVLRKTKVTAEGIMRLQQANPYTWIWY